MPNQNSALKLNRRKAKRDSINPKFVIRLNHLNAAKL